MSFCLAHFSPNLTRYPVILCNGQLVCILQIVQCTEKDKRTMCEKQILHITFWYCKVPVRTYNMSPVITRLIALSAQSEDIAYLLVLNTLLIASLKTPLVLHVLKIFSFLLPIISPLPIEERTQSRLFVFAGKCFFFPELCKFASATETNSDKYEPCWALTSSSVYSPHARVALGLYFLTFRYQV